MDTKVTLYSASWCAFCHATKEYLDKLGVKYTEKDIESNPDFAREAIQKSEQTGIPVLDVDGKIIVGFDRPRIDEALRKAKLIT